MPYLVVTGDDDDTDTGSTTVLDRGFHFFTWGVQHADHAHKRHVRLQTAHCLVFISHNIS